MANDRIPSPARLEARRPGAHRRRRGVVLVLGHLLEAQQRRDRAPNLLLRARVDAHLPRVVQRRAPVRHVEAEVAPVAPEEAPLEPVPAYERDPRRLGPVSVLSRHRLHLLAPLEESKGRKGVAVEARRGKVTAIRVGHDVGDPGHPRRVDERRVLVARRTRVHGDDEELLAAEYGDNAVRVLIVDWRQFDARRKGARGGGGAVLTGQHREGVLAGVEDSGSDEPAYGAGSLRKSLS